MLQCLPTETFKLGFDIVIVRPDSDYDRRQNICYDEMQKKNDPYKEFIIKLKHDNTETKKYGCPLKFR